MIMNKATDVAFDLYKYENSWNLCVRFYQFEDSSIRALLGISGTRFQPHEDPNTTKMLKQLKTLISGFCDELIIGYNLNHNFALKLKKTSNSLRLNDSDPFSKSSPLIL